MPDPIRINELRAAAEARPEHDDPDGFVCMTGTKLAALLDVAEAANTLSASLPHGVDIEAADRLRTTLARLDFTQ